MDLYSAFCVCMLCSLWTISKMLWFSSPQWFMKVVGSSWLVSFPVLKLVFTTFMLGMAFGHRDSFCVCIKHTCLKINCQVCKMFIFLSNQKSVTWALHSSTHSAHFKGLHFTFLSVSLPFSMFLYLKWQKVKDSFSKYTLQNFEEQHDSFQYFCRCYVVQNSI